MCVYIYIHLYEYSVCYMHITVHTSCFPMKRMKKILCKKLNKETGSIRSVHVEETSVHYGVQIDNAYKTSCSQHILSPSVFTKYCFPILFWEILPFNLFHHFGEIIFSIHWFRSWAVGQVGPVILNLMSSITNIVLLFCHVKKKWLLCYLYIMYL